MASEDKITPTRDVPERVDSPGSEHLKPLFNVGDGLQPQGINRMEALGAFALSIATSIISAVSKPFIAKISDITSRPYTYLLILSFYIVGYIIAAGCQTISAYIVGEVFVAIGSSGLDLTNDIIVADLTPLEWRGLAVSMLLTLFIINTGFAGKIVDALERRDQWRWGYGRWAIVMPVALAPAIATLIYLDRRAKKDGIVNMASGNSARRAARELAERDGHEGPRGAIIATTALQARTWTEALKNNLEEIDAFDFVLLGFDWSFLLLPFSLKTYAKHGWRNESLIAMMILSASTSLQLDLYHGDYCRQFLLVCREHSKLVLVVVHLHREGLELSELGLLEDGNNLTLALCIAGPLVGLAQRWTHRYKAIQIAGLCVKLIGMGIMLDGRMATINTGALIMSQILVGFDGPMQLRLHLPSSATEADVQTLFSNVKKIRTLYDFDDPMRQGAIIAYRKTLYYCCASTLGIAFIPLVAAFFQTNYFLGKQNAVTNVGNDGLLLKENH
ncbi:Fc.00g027800.m01.CDS01 [Cosmosporella sp. VM-42]